MWVNWADHFNNLGLVTGVLPLTLEDHVLLLGLHRHLHLPRKSLVFPSLPPLNSVGAGQLISLKLLNQKV